MAEASASGVSPYRAKAKYGSYNCSSVGLWFELPLYGIRHVPDLKVLGHLTAEFECDWINWR